MSRATCWFLSLSPYEPCDPRSGGEDTGAQGSHRLSSAPQGRGRAAAGCEPGSELQVPARVPPPLGLADSAVR